MQHDLNAYQIKMTEAIKSRQNQDDQVKQLKQKLEELLQTQLQQNKEKERSVQESLQRKTEQQEVSLKEVV